MRHDQLLSRTALAHDLPAAGIGEKLDWDAFSARYFPGRRRHDLDAVAAYGAYTTGPRLAEQTARTTPPRLTLVPNEPAAGCVEPESEGAAVERLLVAVAAEQVWEGEGGSLASPSPTDRGERQASRRGRSAAASGPFAAGPLDARSRVGCGRDRSRAAGRSAFRDRLPGRSRADTRLCSWRRACFCLLAQALKAYGWGRLFTPDERPKPLALAAGNGGACADRPRASRPLRRRDAGRRRPPLPAVSRRRACALPLPRHARPDRQRRPRAAGFRRRRGRRRRERVRAGLAVVAVGRRRGGSVDRRLATAGLDAGAPRATGSAAG